MTNDQCSTVHWRDRRRSAITRAWRTTQCIIIIVIIVMITIFSIDASANDDYDDDDHSTHPPSPSAPAAARMRMVISADGIASFVPILTPSSSSVPAGVSISSSFASSTGRVVSSIVPMWRVDQQAEEAKVEQRRREDERKIQADEDANKRKREASTDDATTNTDATTNDAHANQSTTNSDNAENINNNQQKAEGAASDGNDDAHNHDSSSSSSAPSPDAGVPPSSSPDDHHDVPIPPPVVSHDVSIVDDASHGVVMHDPAQALLESLMRATLFQELAQWNAWHHVQQHRPFVLLLLCRCSDDAALDIAGIESLLRANGLDQTFSLLWVQPHTRAMFNMASTYGIADHVPAFVIDNIPIGQHQEKYRFEGHIARQHDVRQQATAAQMVNFLIDFTKAPTPLSLMLRSQPSSSSSSSSSQSSHGDAGAVVAAGTHRGVVDVVGNDFESIVLASKQTVLVMLYSPSCHACHTAMSVLTSLSSSLAWSHPSVVIARIDRVNNDVPIVLRFTSYPSLLLYVGDNDGSDGGDIRSKRFDSTVDGGEEHMNRGLRGSRGWRAPIDYYADRGTQGETCNAPLSVEELTMFIDKHTKRQRNIGMVTEEERRTDVEREEEEKIHQPI